MKSQEIFIARPQTLEQVNALKAFMQALKIKYEVSDSDKYNPDFVQKVLESRQQARDGKTTRVDKDCLKDLLDL
jgi:hypothetical protein